MGGSAETTRSSYLETVGSFSGLSSGLSNWSKLSLLAVLKEGQTVWSGEFSRIQEFGATGYFYLMGVTHEFNDRWYADAHAGSSTGGFFLPVLRTDDFLHKKWLGHKQLVTTIGAGYDRAKDAHRDHRWFTGATYYFDKPWVLEGGLTFNLSLPGPVYSHRQFLAVTQGRDKKRFITVRAGFGTEGYQLIGPKAAISDFASHEVSVTWRQWLRDRWGVNLIAEHYANPFYHRNSVELGLFREF
jgi:YaiO family outer membrane protein